MKEKYKMELYTRKDFMGPQYVCFPIVVLMSEKNLHNWYYMNYMLPVIRLNGPSCLSCNIIDSFEYGSNSNIYNKILRINSINIAFCEQIKDINKVITNEIADEYYCVLFLDSYDLRIFSDCFHQRHSVHEVLFYGYDNILKIYNCYGYVGNSYQCFELSYNEVELSFLNALKYIWETSGWHEYMFMTMDIVAHNKKYPYTNYYFIKKLKQYLQGEISSYMYYENRYYMMESKDSRIAFGIKAINLVLEYLELLRIMVRDGSIYEKFVSQQSPFNMLWSIYEGMTKRLQYFAKWNGWENELEQQIIDYKEKVARRSEIARMLYIKLSCKIKMNYNLESVLDSLVDNLVQIRNQEKEILTEYLNKVLNLDMH